MNRLFSELNLDCATGNSSLGSHEIFLEQLRNQSGRLRDICDFPADSIRSCARFEHIHSSDVSSLLRFYAWLASGCMTTAFIMTQRHAALKRIEASCNSLARERFVERIRSGELFATVGISHLTTSRQHLVRPPLTAKSTDCGWVLNGQTPWSTGAVHADVLVIGAVEISDDGSNQLVDAASSTSKSPSVGRQLLFAIPTSRPGLEMSPGMELISLTSSCTDAVRFSDVEVSADDLLSGPLAPKSGAVNNSPPASASGAGGLQTSALAIGLSAAAISYIDAQSISRPELVSVSESFANTWRHVYRLLVSADTNVAGVLRKQSNDLVLQATQAALAAAKGAGYVDNHDVGRWCREALFFLVWSCPQSVIDAHLCSFSQHETISSL